MGLFKVEDIEDGEVYDVYLVKASEEYLNFNSYFLIFKADEWCWVPANDVRPYIEKRLS